MRSALCLAAVATLVFVSVAEARRGGRPGKRPEMFCNTQADCQKHEDGNLCNGTLYCDNATRSCKLNPATVVNCSTGKDNQCRKNQCNPSTGKCELKSAPVGQACDDGDACTKGDACGRDAVCRGEWRPQMYPNQSQCQCKQNSDCKPHEDGDLCNGTLYCDKATNRCVVNPATKVSCPSVDDTGCRTNTCEPKTGKCEMLSKKQGHPCDDGDKCTSNESCDGKGQCKGSWSKDMYPSKSPCECRTDAHCTGDDNLCDGTLYCDKAAGRCKNNAAKAVTCKYDEQCVPATGKCAKKR